MNRNSTIMRFQALILTAVILFALALLFPMASLARNGGKSALCLANLRILGQAWLTYQEDNDGKLVNGHVPRDSRYADQAYWLTTFNFGGPYKDNAWWVNPPCYVEGTYAEQPSSLQDEDNGIRGGKLFPYVGFSAPYHCPADVSYLRPVDASGYGRGGKRSYSITGLMHGELPNYKDSTGKRLCADTIHEIKQPSAKYFLLENADHRGWNMGSWIMNSMGSQPSWIDPIAVNHLRSSCLSFADGHGEIHSWFDQSTIDMATNQTTYVPINWAAGEGRDILFMVSGYVPVY